MTSTDHHDADDLVARIPVPPHLTRLARKQFENAVLDYADQISDLVRARGGCRTRNPEPEYTVDDVDHARTEYEARSRRSRSAETHARLGVSLSTVATVGIGVMANFLHSPWQIVLFVVLAVAGVIGLVLTWTAQRA